MGADLSKTKPNPKKLSEERNLCSDEGGIWDPIVEERSSEIKSRLRNRKAFIEAVPKFCNNATLISDPIIKKYGGTTGPELGGFYSPDITLTTEQNIAFQEYLNQKEGPSIDLEYYFKNKLRDETREEYLNRFNNLNTTVCTSIGDPVEWMPYELAGVCEYNVCDPGYESGGGCGGPGCCGIVGSKQSCARVAFKGDPVVCCFNDYACSGEDDKCFQTPEKQRTCPPKFRDLASSDCRDTIKKYCTGETLFPTQTNWLEMWLDESEIEVNSEMKVSPIVYFKTKFNNEFSLKERGKAYPLPQKQPCLRAIARNITKQNICSWDELQEGTVIAGNLDPEGLEWGREIINTVFDRFEAESDNGLLEGVNQSGVNNQGAFYNTLWKICNKIPLLCTTGNPENPEGILPKLCKNVTKETLASAPNTIRWCACHMPESEYDDYQNKFNISKECTPMCNREGVIPSITPEGERGYCIQNTCILDTSNINISESQFSEDTTLTFRQLCPGCGKGNIRRRYQYENYKSDGTEITYAIPNPYTLVQNTNTYINIYGSGYSDSNFSSSTRVIECVYTPRHFLDVASINYKTDFTSNNLEVSDVYKTIFVKFGVLANSNNLIGVVNAATEDVVPNIEKDFIIVFSAEKTVTGRHITKD